MSPRLQLLHAARARINQVSGSLICSSIQSAAFDLGLEAESAALRSEIREALGGGYCTILEEWVEADGGPPCRETVRVWATGDMMRLAWLDKLILEAS